MWVPEEYKSCYYLFGEDERVFVFETFRRWLKRYFFCPTDQYRGDTWLNRHMFAHGTASSWQQQQNFSRMVVALTTLAAIESWYDPSQHVSFLVPPMNDRSKLLWQQALLRLNIQSSLKITEEKHFRQYGQLVSPLASDNVEALRQGLLTEQCMNDLVRPLHRSGWIAKVNEPVGTELYMIVEAHRDEQTITIALLYSCATANEIYQNLSKECDVILYCGAPYREDQFARDISIHVGPVLGWQPPLK